MAAAVAPPAFEEVEVAAVGAAVVAVVDGGAAAVATSAFRHRSTFDADALASTSSTPGGPEERR